MTIPLAPAPLILIPGLMCDHGDSDSLSDMAQRILHKAPLLFDLAGHGMGGRVALEVYRLAPARVRRMALMNTGYLPLAVGEAGDKERAGRMQLLALAQIQGMRAMAAQWVRNMVAPARLHDPASINRILDMFERKPAAVFERQIHALLTRPDASDVLTAIHIPCMVMTGEHDGWADVAQHRAMAALLPSPPVVCVIQGAGHMLTMEEPAAVAQVFLNWLS